MERGPEAGLGKQNKRNSHGRSPRAGKNTAEIKALFSVR